jgi:hypothetical protein
MKNVIRLLLAAVALAVTGCDPLMYAKLDEPSVAITNTITAVGLPQVDVPSVTVANVTFQIGDITVDESSKDSSLWLNKATLQLLNPGPGTTFAGIKTASIAISAPPGNTNLVTQVVASYDQARDGPAGDTLVLAATQEINLIPYLSSKTLVVDLTGSGVPPGPLGVTWTADLTLDFHVIAQKNLP